MSLPQANGAQLKPAFAGSAQQPSADTGLPSKNLIQRRFDKASQSYVAHNLIQQQVAAHLLSMLPAAQTALPALLDLGCGPGPNYAQLSQRAQHYIGIDLSQAMLSAHPLSPLSGPAAQSIDARLLQADMEQLPLGTASIDLIYSSMAVQWASSRAVLLGELSRVLKPGGSAVLSMPVLGSLQPLAGFRQAIDQQAQVNPQPTLQTWLTSIAQCRSLQLEHAEQQTFSQYFSSLRDLLHSIKGVGAGANNATPLTRATLQNLANHYETARTRAGLPLHYEVGFVHVKRLPASE